jgi:diguanylate cyclase (GGDEF)-like protein
MNGWQIVSADASGRRDGNLVSEILIHFSNVFKTFGTNRVLMGVNLSIYQGEVTAIIGKSGVGKSVLLKHIIGLLFPDVGEIFLYGRPLAKMKKAEINALRGKFSYVFQDAALFDSMTVQQNIAMPLTLGHAIGQTVLKNFAAQIKQRLDVTDTCSRYSLDKILVVLHNADMEEARKFSTRLSRELRLEDMLDKEICNDIRIRISAGYAQAEEDSLLKEVLAKAESKDSMYSEFELTH